MHILLRILILMATIFTAACGDMDKELQIKGADTVLTNGRIYTVDANRSWAEAVAITDGVFTYVGSAAEVDSAIGSSTTVIDLAGRMVLPAFQDSHIHPISAGLEASACDLNAASDLGRLPRRNRRVCGRQS
jgi:predicted amidohydrolase YtcJ